MSGRHRFTVVFVFVTPNPTAFARSLSELFSTFVYAEDGQQLIVNCSHYSSSSSSINKSSNISSSISFSIRFCQLVDSVGIVSCIIRSSVDGIIDKFTFKRFDFGGINSGKGNNLLGHSTNEIPVCKTAQEPKSQGARKKVTTNHLHSVSPSFLFTTRFFINLHSLKT